MDQQWQEFCDTLLATGNALLASAPDEATRVEGLAYLARVAAYNIERNLLAQARMMNGVMLGGGGVAGSNPDFRYSSAPIQPDQRYRVFEHFYRLPPERIARFYAGALTATDRMRILSGRPPVPVGAALKALLRR